MTTPPPDRPETPATDGGRGGTAGDAEGPRFRRRPLSWAQQVVPATRGAWLRAGIFAAALLVIGMATVSYLDHQERVRCEDAILARGDLRSAVRRTVEVVVEDTQDNPEALAPMIDHVRQVLADEYGDPACADRLGIDPDTIRRDAGLPADPAEAAEAMGHTQALRAP